MSDTNNKPTSILELCDAATKDFQLNESRAKLEAIRDAKWELTKRLSPEVVRAVYENLDRIEGVCDAGSEIHLLANESLRLLSGITKDAK